jgi:hypothetical protein
MVMESWLESVTAQSGNDFLFFDTESQSNNPIDFAPSAHKNTKTPKYKSYFTTGS